MKRILIFVILVFCFSPAFADEPESASTPPAIAEPALTEATGTISISKAKYEKLTTENDALRRENQRLVARRNQLLAENERLAAEIGVWRARLERVLQCSTIVEAIEELRVILANQNPQGEKNP